MSLTLSLAAGANVVAEEKPVLTLPIADLKAEADYNVNFVSEAIQNLENDDAFKGVQKKVKRAGGTLAVVAQVMVHHPEKESAGVAAADLRDAGIAIRDAKDVAAAKAGLEAAIKAYAGEASGSASDEAEFKGLIGMHDMMEVIAFRNSKLLRGVKKFREPQEDKLHAVAIAVLSVPMEMDTHEVKDEADVPAWKELAMNSQKIAVELAKAMAAEDEDAAQEIYKNLGATCKECHTKFRVEE